MTKTLICSRHFLHSLYLEGLYKTNEPFIWEDEACDVLCLNVKYRDNQVKDYFGDKQFLENNQAILVLDKNREQVIDEYFEYDNLYNYGIRSSKLSEFNSLKDD